MKKTNQSLGIRANGTQRTNNVLRKSVYFPDPVLDAMHMGYEWEGGLSERVATIILNYDILYGDLRPSFLTTTDWLDIFNAMDQPGGWDNPISLAEHIEECMHTSEENLSAVHVAEVMRKLSMMTATEWMMLHEAYFRFKNACKSMTRTEAVKAVTQ